MQAILNDEMQSETVKEFVLDWKIFAGFNRFAEKVRADEDVLEHHVCHQIPNRQIHNALTEYKGEWSQDLQELMEGRSQGLVVTQI